MFISVHKGLVIGNCGLQNALLDCALWLLLKRAGVPEKIVTLIMGFVRQVG